MTKKVSVIIPTYKPKQYLWECLDSLQTQTLSKELFDIVIILNGCKEPYATQIKEYINLCSSIDIYLYQTDQPGVSNARNIGIDCSCGEYLAFIDDDDIVSSTYLADLLSVSTPSCVGCSTSYAFVNDISERRESFMSRAFDRCKSLPYSLYSYRQFLSPPVIKMIHRDIIGNTRFLVSLKKSEDSVFCFQLTPKISEMRLAADTAVYYQRIREGSAMRTKHSNWQELKQLVELECAYLRVWSKNPFAYNFKFLLTRMVAGFRNFLVYTR